MGDASGIVRSAPDPQIVAGGYLSAEFPGLGGEIKLRPEDFMVDEVPLYQPAGQGEHIYLFVQKRDMNSSEMVRVIARHFGVRRSAVGVAGMKDRQAVTRQTVSVHTPGKKPEDFASLEHEKLVVLWADLHTNKLKRGHLIGNRFSIKVRGVRAEDALVANRVLGLLHDRGVPNVVGEQRFGFLQNNHLVGLAAYMGDAATAVSLILSEHERSPDAMLEARRLYASGAYAEAYEAMPPTFLTERALLRALAAGRDPEDAWFQIDPAIRGYYYSAFQSAAFNTALWRRVEQGSFGELIVGDLAFRFAGRTTFAIDAVRAADRAVMDDLAAFRVSPSGPMWGPDMKRASGDVDRLELSALGRFGVRPADLDLPLDDDAMSVGTRRPLRVPLGSPEVEGGLDEHGPYVRCAFDLPRGSFATTVMREVMKPSLGEAGVSGGRGS